MAHNAGVGSAGGKDQVRSRQVSCTQHQRRVDTGDDAARQVHVTARHIDADDGGDA